MEKVFVWKNFPAGLLWLVGLLSVLRLLFSLAGDNPFLIFAAVLLTIGLEGSKISLYLYGGWFGKLLSFFFILVTIFAVANTSFSSIETVRMASSQAQLEAIHSSLAWRTAYEARTAARADKEALRERYKKLPGGFSTAAGRVSAAMESAQATIEAQDAILLKLEGSVGSSGASGGKSDAFFAFLASAAGDSGLASWLEFSFSVLLGLLCELSVVTALRGAHKARRGRPSGKTGLWKKLAGLAQRMSKTKTVRSKGANILSFGAPKTRKRGRPLGSKNKPKLVSGTPQLALFA